MKSIALLTTIPSDSHTWNLIFMELFLMEQGFIVRNLGACAPIELTLRTCHEIKPDVMVVSTVNGHGYIEGTPLIRQFRENQTTQIPVYLGGKLCTDTILSAVYAEQLEQQGFTKVYTESADLEDFKLRLAKIENTYAGIK